MNTSGVVIIILILVIIGGVIWYHNNKRPIIPNKGTINTDNNDPRPILKNRDNDSSDVRPVMAKTTMSPLDLYGDSDNDIDNINRDSTYAKRPCIRKSRREIEDEYNPDDLLPQEVHDDFFDLGALQSEDALRDAHLVHPKRHFGETTVNSSKRNQIHDIRGEIYNPKRHVSPFMMSTIEPNLYSRSLC